MDFKELDKKAKKTINENIKGIPDGVNKRIDETLNGLGNKKKKSPYIKKIAIAAGAVLAIGITGVTTTAVAKGIPVKDLVYEMFGYEDTYTKYATEVNETIEWKGTKATVTSAVHDGYKMYIAFKIEGDKEEIDEIKDRTSLSLKSIEGETMEGYEASYRMKKEGDNTIVGVFELELRDVQIKGNTVLGYKENMNVEIALEQFINEEMEGNFKFKIEVSAKNVKDDVKVYKVNKEIKEGTIKEVIVTPFEIYVKGDKKIVTEKEEKNKERFYNYMLRDADGIVSSWERSDMYVQDKKEFTMSFKNKFKDLSKIDIIVAEENEKAKDKKLNMIIKNGKVTFDKNEDITILEGKYKNDILELKYKANNPLLINLYIEDRVDKELEESLNIVQEIEAIDKNTAIIKFKGKLNDGVYRVSCGSGDNYKIIDEVNLIK